MCYKKCHLCGKTKPFNEMHQIPYGPFVSNGDGTASYRGGQWECDYCEDD